MSGIGLEKKEYKSFSQEYFRVPLIDLGEKEERFAGILMPEPEIDEAKVGITDQFLENASTYDSIYSSTSHFRALFGRVLQNIQMPDKQTLSVLDIGAGSGANSAVPFLQIFPNSQIVATDLSPQLLSILKSYIISNEINDKVSVVCTDATSNYFFPHIFDCVIGSSILHHILDPKLTLSAVARALAPGGIAIFFEPFEGGSVILRSAFELILRDPRSKSTIDKSVCDLLLVLATDFKFRTGRDKSAEHFKYMDDKWLFTRQYLMDAATASGFEDVTIVPLHEPEQIFHRLAVVLLRIGGNFSEDSLPAWAWDYVDLFDDVFSDDLKKDLINEGGLVFRKAKS